MPCALTSDADYPDYLKSILKEIEVGNDEKLQACACSLKTPITDEGCPITDSDGKLGLFPECLVIEDNGLQLFTLKEIMEIYWKTKSFTLNVNFNYDDGESKSFTIEMPYVGSTSGKEKVCPSAVYQKIEGVPGLGGYVEVYPNPRKKNEEENLYSLDITAFVQFSWEVYSPDPPLYAISQWQVGGGDRQGTLNGKNINYSGGFDEERHTMGSSILKLTANF